MGEVGMGEFPVMSCDIQEAGGFHAWAIVRAWNTEGKSRLVWAGRLAAVLAKWRRPVMGKRKDSSIWRRVNFGSELAQARWVKVPTNSRRGWC